MKKMKDKVEKHRIKRRHVDWYEVFNDMDHLSNPDLYVDFLNFRKKGFSVNRSAYLAILKHSTTATMRELRLKYAELH